MEQRIFELCLELNACMKLHKNDRDTAQEKVVRHCAIAQLAVAIQTLANGQIDVNQIIVEQFRIFAPPVDALPPPVDALPGPELSDDYPFYEETEEERAERVRRYK